MCDDICYPFSLGDDDLINKGDVRESVYSLWY